MDAAAETPENDRANTPSSQDAPSAAPAAKRPVGRPKKSASAAPTPSKSVKDSQAGNRHAKSAEGGKLSSATKKSNAQGAAEPAAPKPKAKTPKVLPPERRVSSVWGLVAAAFLGLFILGGEREQKTVVSESAPKPNGHDRQASPPMAAYLNPRGHLPL